MKKSERDFDDFKEKRMRGKLAVDSCRERGFHAPNLYVMILNIFFLIADISENKIKIAEISR